VKKLTKNVLVNLKFLKNRPNINWQKNGTFGGASLHGINFKENGI